LFVYLYYHRHRNVGEGGRSWIWRPRKTNAKQNENKEVINIITHRGSVRRRRKMYIIIIIIIETRGCDVKAPRDNIIMLFCVLVRVFQQTDCVVDRRERIMI